MRYIRTAPVALAVSGVLLLTGAKCTPAGGGHHHHVGSASLGLGLTVHPVGLGDPPASGPLVRPVGVAIRGPHAGAAVWIMSAAAAAAGVGAVTDRAIRLVGNDPLAMTGDPCQNEPDSKRIAAWKRTPMHPRVYLDCGTWRNIKRYSQTRNRNISVVLRCLTRVIGLGDVTPGIKQAARYVWRFPGVPGGDHSGEGVATVLTDQEGRITSAHVTSQWKVCAGVAK